MNFQQQLDALEAGITQLLAQVAQQGGAALTAMQRQNAASAAPRPYVAAAASEVLPATAQDDGPPVLHLSLPTQNELALTIKNQSIAFNALQLDQLIEKLASVRAAMQP